MNMEWDDKPYCTYTYTHVVYYVDSATATR